MYTGKSFYQNTPLMSLEIIIFIVFIVPVKFIFKSAFVGVFVFTALVTHQACSTTDFEFVLRE